MSDVETVENSLEVPLSIYRFEKVCFPTTNATSARVKFPYITLTHSLRMPESLQPTDGVTEWNPMTAITRSLRMRAFTS